MTRNLIGYAILATFIVFIAVVGRDGPKPETGDLTDPRPKVPADQNAFTFFEAATNALAAPDNDLARDYLAGRPADEKLLQEAIVRNAEMMEVLKQGLSCKICLCPEQPASSLETPFLRPFHSMATVLALSSRSARLSGNYAKAVDDCLALVRFGDLLQADAKSLVDYLIGNGVMGKGLTQAQDLARDPGTPAEELKRVSAGLASLGPFDHGLVSAVQGEFRFMAHMIDAVWQGQLSPAGKVDAKHSDATRTLRGTVHPLYFFQPNNTKRLLAAFDRDIIRSAPLPYAEVRICDTDTLFNLKKGSFLQMARPNTIGKILLSTTLPALGKGLEHKCRAECNVAATRLLIALHRYRKEKGDWPSDLKALTPDYLATIPADPFDGKPFRFVPARGILYSVGKDLQDSGGSTLSLKESKKYPSSALRWMTEDAVYEIGD